eukprot:gnl/MRDRNA2_/MRDRNA2_32170_c0_seq1.p1 gnl/MRDRNA2_/MRDRNA2_32170_c0~~gnl/MRDRNA2_/MRDRNA2_32170_c0_seq1.p1  ORF type:complete len:571 (+),score=75.89 gnl/MRDRNA2_/MRDRNA2_32170_c0_seq1:119-1714(+)
MQPSGPSSSSAASPLQKLSDIKSDQECSSNGELEQAEHTSNKRSSNRWNFNQKTVSMEDEMVAQDRPSERIGAAAPGILCISSKIKAFGGWEAFQVGNSVLARKESATASNHSKRTSELFNQQDTDYTTKDAIGRYTTLNKLRNDRMAESSRAVIQNMTSRMSVLTSFKPFGRFKVMSKLGTINDKVWKKSAKSRNESECAPQWLLKLIKHPMFEMCVSFSILSNTLSIGFQTHWAAQNRGKDLAEDESMGSLLWFVSEIIFCLFFTSELTMRLIAEGQNFLFGRNWPWNLFDSVVVAASISEQFVFFLAKDASEQSSQLGMVRFLRIVRIVRLMRVMRFLPDLRNMISGILSAVRSLFWSMVLLAMVMFAFGVLFTEVVNMNYSYILNIDEEHELFSIYEDVVVSIYNLFQAISGGVDWGQMSDPLLDLGWMYCLLFMAYVSFSVFCVLNIIAAVFVQQSNKICSQDKENIVLEEIEARKRFHDEVAGIFNEADQNKTGTIDRRTFAKHFSSPSTSFLAQMEAGCRDIWH